MSCTTLPSNEFSQAQRRIPWPTLSVTGWFLIFGLALRLIHYAWNHTIWYDEAVLLANILGRDYSQLLGPLDYEVGAPPLFLWGLRTILMGFGDHAYVWRFPPFVISCLTLALMAVLARRLLPPAPAAFVIGLVAFSDKFVWLGCNVKPYVLDAFLAAGILYAYMKTEDWPTTRRLLAFMAAAPVLLCVSYPMLFLYAGLMLAFLPVVGGQRRIGPWAAYLGLAAVVLATFACLYFGPIQAQRVAGLVAGWMNKFPDLTRPASIPGWVIGNTFLVFHYCYNPVGTICLLIAGAGAWWCLRNGRFDWVCLCLGPVAVCLLAAFMQVYPFSGNRLIFFVAPGIGVMTGLGISVILDRWRRRLSWVLAGLGVLLILPEVGLSLLHLDAPWAHPDSSSTAGFIKERLQPGDQVATDEDTYSYFFLGQRCSLDEAARRPSRAGQRIWVPMDHYPVEGCLPYIEGKFSPTEWELRTEALFYRANAFLLIRRNQGQASPNPVNRDGKQGGG